ncbi:MAG TPA: Ig-like domain-containing protein [Devosiaceae bacterium]|jgi:hypothetical protein
MDLVVRAARQAVSLLADRLRIVANAGQALLPLLSALLVAVSASASLASAGCDVVNAGGLNGTRTNNSDMQALVTDAFDTGDTLSFHYDGQLGAIARMIASYQGPPVTNDQVVDMVAPSGPITGSGTYVVSGSKGPTRRIYVQSATSSVATPGFVATPGAQVTWAVTCLPAGSSATVPGTPTIGTATAGNAQASVTFTAPGSNGGSPITDYTVTSSPGSITKTGTASPITITGLSNGQTYTFTVKASNAVGPGSPSAPSNAVTPNAPPVAHNGTALVSYNTPRPIDVSPLIDGAHTSIAIVSAPQHGTTSISGDVITYTPTSGYFGPDTLSYRADGPGGSSDPAVLSVTVANPPAPGAADRSGVAVPYETAQTIDLTASVTGVSDAVAVATGPSHGVASVLGKVVTYMPSPGYFGADSFTYTATGPGGTSAPATVSLIVATPPAPNASSVTGITVPYETAQAIDLSVSITGVHTSIAIASGPAKGNTSINGDVVTYTPNAGALGADTFTYTATGPGGTSASAIVSLTILLPAAPTVQPFSGITVPYNTAQNIDLAAGITGVHTSIAVATNPAHGSTGVVGDVIIYTPASGYSGTDGFTYTATGPGGTSAPATVSLTVTTPDAPLVADRLGVAVAHDTATDINLATSITGVSAGIAVATGPTHGSANVTGYVVRYTPTSGYGGADSFTYTATGPGGTSAPATVSVNVAATQPDAPAIGTATAGNGQASVSFTAPSVTGGSAITGYRVTSSPGNITATGSASPIVVTGLTNGTTYTFTVTASNDVGTGAPSDASNPVTPLPGAPVANPLNGVAVPYETAATIDLTASITGVHTGIAIVTGSVHGATGILGDVVTYTPASGYYGTDSFTYAATGPGGTSAPAAVSLTVATPAAPVVAGTTASVAFNTQKAIDLTGSITGVHTGIAVDTAPAHGATSVAGDVVTYTPASGYAGTDSFTYTATGPGGTSAPATVGLTVTAITLTFAPAAGTLDDAMAGEGYEQAITASGGSGSVLYDLDSGALPDGLVLNRTTGAITGTVKASVAPATFTFTISATDAHGAKGTVTYALKVVARAVTASDKVIVLKPGETPLPVDLTKGATGGPFVSATIGTVMPSEAGTAEVNMGDVASIDTVYPKTFYLKFHPNPEFSGTAVIGFTLVNGGGASSSATVSFKAVLDPVGVADRIDGLVHDFIRTRQSLIATSIVVPGLLERRAMATGNAPGTVNIAPSDNSIALNFASSLAEMRAWNAAGDAAGALAANPVGGQDPFNVWINGSVALHLRSDDNDDDHWGKFGLVSVGADYLVNDKLLVGLALHTDVMDDLTDTSKTTGTGVLVGPYVSAEIGDGVFLDASLFYGRTWNEVSTSLFSGTFESDQLVGNAKLEGQWALSDVLTFRPNVTAFYLHETVGDYTVSNAIGDTVAIAGFSSNQFRLSAGGTLQYTMGVGDGLVLMPYVGANLGLTATDGFDVSNGAFALVSGGFTLTGDGDWTMTAGVKANIEASGLKTIAATAGFKRNF